MVNNKLVDLENYSGNSKDSLLYPGNMLHTILLVQISFQK